MPRILIVDDYVDNGEILAAALTARGHETAFVADGAEAIARAQTFHPDVAILDIMLPDMDGYELARALRVLPGMEQLSLIAITGFARDPEAAKAAGFHGHVLKPVSLDKVEEAVRAAIAAATR